MFRVRVEAWLRRWSLLILMAMLAISVRLAVAGVSDKTIDVRTSASVSWAPSTGLLVAEVVTRGAAASDQYVELYNASALTQDLGGLEIVYVTASGATITRKQTWTSQLLGPGSHLLIANSAGTYAAAADGTFSGGFSTTGGSLVLRQVGGNVIDSLSWGSAVSSFVEGTPGSAPPTGSSLERKPGGAGGNWVDTNDNSLDAFVQSSPVPQGLSSAPVATPTPTATATVVLPTPTAAPTQGASSTPTAAPTAEPTCTPTEVPTPTPTPTLVATSTPTPASTASATPTLAPTDTPSPTVEPPTPQPTDSPSPLPSPTDAWVPTPMPTTTPTASASPSPTPSPTPIPTSTPPPPSPTPSATPTPTPTQTPLSPGTLIEARGLAAGTRVLLHGRLTTPPGLTDGGLGAYMEDATAGIALRLLAGLWPQVATGTDLAVWGVLADHYGQVTLDIASPGDLAAEGSGPLPDPLVALTGGACEALESRLVSVTGWLIGPSASGDEGLTTSIDDGTGGLTVVAPTASGIVAGDLVSGTLVRLVGVFGQHDLNGLGVGGYRIYLRSLDDIVPIAAPTPTPTGTPTPTPTPVPTPTPTSTPSPTPSSTASPAGPISIADARSHAIGDTVTVRGVVTVAPGWILGDSTVAIQDATGGIYVKLPDATLARVIPGRIIEAQGVLAAPYGNLEMRPGTGQVAVLEMSVQPSPRPLQMGELGESTEGLLARSSVTVTEIETSTSGSLTLIVSDSSGDARVYLHSPMSPSSSDYHVGENLLVIGLVGDRLGLYRLWPRNLSDIGEIVGPTPSPTPTPHATPTPTPYPTPTPTATPHPTPTSTATPSPTPSSAPSVISIADALRLQGQTVTIEATVNTRPGLLDSDGQRVGAQDATAGILVRLPANASASVGETLRITGTVGTYYGAPQLTAVSTASLRRSSLSATVVRSAPLAPGLEWRLVTVTGEITAVHRDGDAWHAEMAVNGGSIPVAGLSRSGIASTALVSGRSATITGIVKRAYPTATDQRLSLVPRTASDIDLGTGPTAGPSPSPRPTSGGPGQAQDPWPAGSSGSPGGNAATPGARLSGDVGSNGHPQGQSAVAAAQLADHEGEIVEIGGRVVSLDGSRVTVEDASGLALIELLGAATDLEPVLSVGDLLNVTGTVVRDNTGQLELAVDDPALVSRLAVPAGSSVPATAGPTNSQVLSNSSPAPIDVPAPVPALAVALSLALVATLLVGGTGLLVATMVGRERRGRLMGKISNLFARLRARLPRTRVAKRS